MEAVRIVNKGDQGKSQEFSGVTWFAKVRLPPWKKFQGARVLYIIQ
jgi:hypothetical protein